MQGYDGEIERRLERLSRARVTSVAPTDELSLLAPLEIIAGYYHRVGVSWKGGTTLRRTVPMEVDGQ